MKNFGNKVNRDEGKLGFGGFMKLESPEI